MFGDFILIMAGDNCIIRRTLKMKGRKECTIEFKRGMVRAFGMDGSSSRSVVAVTPTTYKDDHQLPQFRPGDDVVSTTKIIITYEETKAHTTKTDAPHDIYAAKRLSLEMLLALALDKVEEGNR